MIEDETFVGYSLGNPINEALKEAEMIFGEKQSIKAILSLGAGKGELKSIKELPGVESKILGTLERLGLSSERLANETAYRFQEVDFYSRFNISLDEGDAPSDLWSNPKHEFIMTSTRSQVVFSIMSQRLDEAVAKLVSQKGVMEIRELSKCLFCLLCPDLNFCVRPTFSTRCYPKTTTTSFANVCSAT